jgi:hypothetical protein
MYNLIHDPEATKTWAARDLADTDDMDIPARRQAGQITTIPRQFCVMKHRHGMPGTGKFVQL